MAATLRASTVANLLTGAGGYHNLKALIKAIRACKTLADERSLIQKESAAIRTSFKEEDSFLRHNNIAKLLYIHMLGYPAHFGQIECLKLVASPRFADKRLGYLGIMLLLDENQEVLTLVTNSLKNDMNHSNMYIVGLALCTFANISSEEMSRDLCNEIEKLLGSSNTYIRKKAALCALRIVRRVPDLIDHFIENSKILLSDRNHGVLLTGVTLVTEMCENDSNVLPEFRKAVPLLIRHLKSLVTTGYSPEHDVSGITDPFLQTKILRLIRILGKGDAQSSEAVNDILAQIATNTDSAKNVGNSILYETVLTVLEIEADASLRVMAINILGKFLTNRDNNIRYVALNTLNKVVTMDTNAVLRHQNTILDCLRDGDISIRRRALELSYALVRESNVRVLIRELLAFLEVADNEFKLGMTTQISLAAERFAPNRRWHIDTVLRVLKLAGNFVREEILSSFIRLVCHTPELQSYTVSRLFVALQSDVSQESLTLAAVWLIGEFSDILLAEGVTEEEQHKNITPADIIDLFDSVLQSPYANALIRQFILTSITKLSTRISPNDPQQQRIHGMLSQYTTSQELEIQQRAVEFSSLFGQGEITEGVLERMPPPEIKATVLGVVSEAKPVGPTRQDKDSLIDLMGDEASTAAPATNGASAANPQDLLKDIFGSDNNMGGSSSQAAALSPAGQQKATFNDILGLFDQTPATFSPTPAPAPSAPTASMSGLSDMASLFGPSPSAAASMSSSLGTAPAPPAPSPAKPAAPKLPAYSAYDKNNLKVTLTPQPSVARPGMVTILATFTATDAVTGLNFQAAVPKTQQLQMLAISDPNVLPGTPATQQMRVIAPAGAQIRLRLRFNFTTAGRNVQDQVDFAGFPTDLTVAK
ncbi:AP-1 complex subunit gamma-1 [Dacryopinax primogenitus]|uniref:AP-1 complex subunit gamma n=1 Tax=Dacryopinax primogenitus (strain DJM 731) TaxID=1858805 RepID=M5FZW7_DACPD|nr:AP-1 complex subunit gamma-1 [Dacryopinax primogenitus]EJU03561.1 AP-1 complex subunit gamma-1 [Dacryopinax primogenitus]